MLTQKAKESEFLYKQENLRFKAGFHSAGWSEKKINDLMLFIKSGDERYKPKPDDKTESQTDK